jgi:hypothetical protein
MQSGNKIMSDKPKQDHVYKIVRALAALPGAGQIRITWSSVTEQLRPHKVVATENNKFFPADKIPNDIDVSEDSINCAIVLFGEMAPIPAGTDLADSFAKNCQAQSIEQTPDARIEATDDGQPDAQYMIEIPLWAASGTMDG